jgi:hypothetical protein
VNPRSSLDAVENSENYSNQQEIDRDFGSAYTKEMHRNIVSFILLVLPRVRADSQRDFELNTGFIDHFNIRLVITFNYNAIANFHTSQFTRAQVKPFPTSSVFTSSCRVKAPNNGYSSASGFT